MNILYGVQATGNGHISRSREVIRALKASGHHVHVIFSGRDARQLWDVELFQPCTIFSGMTFAVQRGKINYLKTVTGLHPLQLYRDVYGFPAKGFDVAIIDFEPITARIARKHKIFSIGIGHQYAFQYPVPVARFDPMAMLVLRRFAPVDVPIGLHWHHFGYPILPPIVPPLPIDTSDPVPGKILVYLPFEDRRDVLDLLSHFPAYDFYYYTGVDTAQDLGNRHVRPFSRQGFIDDLLTCEGVICNAGFELASEAMHLGKKLLVRPLAGQLEQTSNAMVIENLHLGAVMQELDRGMVARWLAQDGARPLQYPDVARMLAEWIGTGDWRDGSALAGRAWARVPQGAPVAA